MKLRNVELEHIRNTMESSVFKGTSFSELIFRLLEEAEQLREENERLKQVLKKIHENSHATGEDAKEMWLEADAFLSEEETQ